MTGVGHWSRHRSGNVITGRVNHVRILSWLATLDEVVYFVVSDRQHRIYAVDNRIIWLTTPDPNLLLDLRCGAGGDSEYEDLQYIDKVWHNSEVITKLSFSRWNIPIWSLVLPPTVLSAYLILWKPRKRSCPN
jgi:hypothetical protein